MWYTKDRRYGMQYAASFNRFQRDILEIKWKLFEINCKFC